VTSSAGSSRSHPTVFREGRSGGFVFPPINIWRSPT
jgi:hypothetical protein